MSVVTIPEKQGRHVKSVLFPSRGKKNDPRVLQLFVDRIYRSLDSSKIFDRKGAINLGKDTFDFHISFFQRKILLRFQPSKFS